ncbi:MAG: hypothetical protein ABI658_30895, partial [Acidimicrobiales bacterium]
MTPLGSPRRRHAIAMVMALTVGFVFMVASGQPAQSAPTRPPVPVDPDADSSSSVVVTAGEPFTATAALADAFDARGNPVDPLGGIYSCGEFGCVSWGVAWITTGFTVVDGCTGSSQTCTLTATAEGSWSEVKALHGLTNGIVVKTTALWVYIDRTTSDVIVDAVDSQGHPLASPAFGGPAYFAPGFAVKDGADPTASECTGDPCIPLGSNLFAFVTDKVTGQLVRGQIVYAALPIGSSWTIYVFSIAPVGTAKIRQLPRVWSAVRVTPDGSNFQLYSTYNGVDDPVPGSTSTTSTTSTTLPETTTTIVAQAPQPPVVTSATSGAPGVVSGTVAGQPGATVTVQIASSSAAPCVKLMSGAGVTTVGSTQVLLNQSGAGSFAINGNVAAGSFVYGTTTAGTTSSVGECFTVPTPPPPPSSTTSTSTTTSTT